MNRAGLILAIAASLTLSGCQGPPAIGSPAPSAGTDVPEKARGIDVSHTQGEIDWPAVAGEGPDFVFIKATEGDDFVDPDFQRNWSGAKSAGILRGAYHFFRPEDTGAAQAENFLATVKLGVGDLPAVLDVEVLDSVPDQQLVSELRTWLDKVQAATGVTPILYTGRAFWNSLGSEARTDYPLWIAEYDVEHPTLPSGWSTWTFWQYSSSGSVSGITGHVDQSRFNGSSEELRRLAVPSP